MDYSVKTKIVMKNRPFLLEVSVFLSPWSLSSVWNCEWSLALLETVFKPASTAPVGTSQLPTLSSWGMILFLEEREKARPVQLLSGN